MSATKIEWATHVLNGMTGCDRVSPGCAECYALNYAPRLKAQELGRAAKMIADGRPAPTMRYQLDGDPRTSGPGFGFAVHWDKLLKPPRFPAGARVFVNSMSDVFHEKAPLEAIAALWAVFLAQPEVNWLVLTKRADRMRDVLNDRAWWESVGARSLGLGRDDVHVEWRGELLPAPANVWLGVSVENRAFVHRADDLRATPAAVRFVSAEPLLGPLVPHLSSDADYGHMWWDHRGELVNIDEPGLSLEAIDWLIVGGESNGRAGRRLVDEHNEPRADRIEWVRDLRRACLLTRSACLGDADHSLRDCPLCEGTGIAPGGTALFFKQWGGRKPTSGGRMLDGFEWSQFPRPAPVLTA